MPTKFGIFVGTFERPNGKLVGNHFVAYMLNFENMTALVVDSYGTKLRDIDQFLEFLTQSGFNVQSHFLGTQSDTNSCGIYAAQYAIQMLKGNFTFPAIPDARLISIARRMLQ